MMITLFGATGYTGRLVAAALARAGLPFRLAGRSPAKLARLAESLPGSPTWLLADAGRPETLLALLADARLLINCAGPFTDLGEPVVAQAALHGVDYLDTTNELGYVYRLRSYDALARQNGAALVPACGFEVALADCAVACLAGDDTLDWEEVRVTYNIRGRGSSFGSRRSAVRALATSWLGYRDGGWQPAIPGSQVRRVPLPGGTRPAISFPSSEAVTVPGHLPVGRVTTWLAISWPAALWAPLLVPAFAWLARGPLGRVVEALISRVAPPPASGLRSEAPWAIVVEVIGGAEHRAMTLAGRGVYDLTAEIVAYAAGWMVQPGYDRAGLLAPAAALDPQALLDRAERHWGVKT